MRTVLFLAGLVLCNIVYAEGNQVAEPIEIAFDRWVDDGVLGGELKATRNPNPNDNIINLKAKDLEGTRVGTSKSVYFAFKWSLFSSNKQYMPAMRQVKSELDKTCSDGGGRLEFFPFAVRHTEILKIKINDLRKESLFGDYLCSTAGSNFFQAEVYPLGDVKTSLVGGFEWDVYVHLVNKKQFESQEIKFAERNQAAKINQESLQPGAYVAIQASELPDSIIKGAGVRLDDSFLSDRKYMLCGMVIDVKPALVQLQVGKDTFYVNKSKVFPFVKSVSPKAGKYTLWNWSEWCFM